jgi:hypothetical protein
MLSSSLLMQRALAPVFDKTLKDQNWVLKNFPVILCFYFRPFMKHVGQPHGMFLGTFLAFYRLLRLGYLPRLLTKLAS